MLNLRLPLERLEVEIAVESGERIRGWVQSPRGVRGSSGAFGGRIDLDALLDQAPSTNPVARTPVER